MALVSVWAKITISPLSSTGVSWKHYPLTMQQHLSYLASRWCNLSRRRKSWGQSRRTCYKIFWDARFQSKEYQPMIGATCHAGIGWCSRDSIPGSRTGSFYQSWLAQDLLQPRGLVACSSLSVTQSLSTTVRNSPASTSKRFCFHYQRAFVILQRLEQPPNTMCKATRTNWRRHYRLWCWMTFRPGGRGKKMILQIVHQSIITMLNARHLILSVIAWAWKPRVSPNWFDQLDLRRYFTLLRKLFSTILSSAEEG